MNQHGATAATSLLDRVRRAVDPSAQSPPPPPGRRRASVLMLFDTREDVLPLLFILRSPGLRTHAGQIAFPGGTEEPDDGGVIATALREAQEEVGLPRDHVDVIGTLPPLLTAVSDVWLTPVVGLLAAPWSIVTDDQEVEEWFWIDLASLLAAQHTVREFPRDGRSRAVHFYEVSGRVIWGVSGAILNELLGRIAP